MLAGLLHASNLSTACEGSLHIHSRRRSDATLGELREKGLA